ncbi:MULTISPECIES: hypothetical protein [Lysobacter]|uniref:hypothetical protein n=1 Tax=Lysobacter TaxID=68 RepID=UPI001F42CF8B|nr:MULTISPECIES: hypothetical protein [Lysobacter]UJB20231.1 hypothetical protein L1A79_03845 [Lysobacter capsici]UJQ30655.1 hypothetical protein L2D09_11015 [Lysobacter gummosus]
MKARWIVSAAILAAMLIYSVGLDGPYLFDDTFNLIPVRLWAAGRLDWSEVMFGNVSGVLGRPVSMASFMLSAAIGGATPLDYKAGNLAIHLICSVLIFRLLQKLLAADHRSPDTVAVSAGLLTALWLLHPLHVSTVLYAVQRMAQLSTLFVLLALLAYLRGRSALISSQLLKARIWLFAAFPALWLLGLLSKENAAVASALCLVLELAYFKRDEASKRTLAWFYATTLILPVLLAGLVAVIRPSILLGGYRILEFDMPQRLLSQARALFSYLGMLIFPRGENMSVFNDDFAISTGLLSPPSTMVALLALVAISVIVIVLRRRAPHLFAGWFFFLVAHGVESTILPLELYFEHRNYLPSVGLLLMIAGLISLLPEKLRNDSRLQYGALTAFALCAAALASITWQQANIWRSKEAIVDQSVRNHPHSLRAVQAKMIEAINRKRYEQAFALISPMANSNNPRIRLLAHLDMTSIRCLSGNPPDPAWLDQAIRDARDRLTLAETQTVGLLMQVSRDHRCGKQSEQRIAATIAAIANKASGQADNVGPKWQLHYAAAIIYGRIGHWSDALTELRHAWQPGVPSEVGALLVQALAHNGLRDEAARLLWRLNQETSAKDRAGQAALEPARKMISAHP